ncbi:MAG: ABC transporter permease [Coriobacteriales bacterium]|jgi:ABC-2 type transport system permease protein|nr:ABC transporter permease [Coriobacteriales bacterium]
MTTTSLAQAGTIDTAAGGIPGTTTQVLSQRLGRVARELNSVLSITARDITLVVKDPTVLVTSLIMPLLMMGMIGGNLMQNMAGGLGFDFGEFMLVGMFINMLFMSTTMGMSTLVDDHEIDYTQEMLVAPVSRYSLIIGKVLGSSFMGLISALMVLVVGLVMGITLSIGQMLTLLALAPLMCLAGGALATIILGVVHSKRAANYAIMLITMPQMFLSGVVIPINHSEGLLMVLSRLMPMTYCVDLARSVLYGDTAAGEELVMFDPVVNLVAILGLTVACLVLGTWLFARGARNR